MVLHNDKYFYQFALKLIDLVVFRFELQIGKQYLWNVRHLEFGN